MEKLKLDPRNVRKHGKRNQQVIGESLRELGAGRSILIDSSNTAVAGNGVLEQAKKLGFPIRIVESDGTELVAVQRITHCLRLNKDARMPTHCNSIT